MKPSSFRLLGVLAFLTAASLPATANLVINPGFEDPVTTDGPPFVGFWEAFNGGAGALAANSSLMPRSGAQSLNLSITSTDNTFAGAFQDIGGLSAGIEYIFSGWHATPSSPLDLGTEFRIEWRNSISNTEISRTPNSTTAPGAAYGTFSLNATVPVGADTARLVYAIQTFGPEPGNNGSVFIDDLSFVAVPEPSTFILAGLGGLALIMARRRRA